MNHQYKLFIHNLNDTTNNRESALVKLLPSNIPGEIDLVPKEGWEPISVAINEYSELVILLKSEVNNEII